MPAIVTANNAMRRVPKTFDGGDIDDHGHWYGQDKQLANAADVRRVLSRGCLCKGFLSALDLSWPVAWYM